MAKKIKTPREIEKSAKARYRQMLKHAQCLITLAIAPGTDFLNMSGTHLADMRDEVEQINQTFHEFNAYWNVLNTGSEE